MSIDALIEGVIGREGRYSNHPSDTGGETMWGITVRVARNNGYSGPMRTMPRDVAKAIYFRRYVQEPGFAGVMALNEPIAEELVDTGVNMGPTLPARWLQECLNALNQQGKAYADIKEDGDIGPATLNALKLFLKSRKNAESIMLKALNALQGARYIELARGRQANEDFLNGWLANRVGVVA